MMASSVVSACCRCKIGWKPMPGPSNETLRLRAERKLEDCRGANAFEQNPLNAHRAWGHHRHRRGDPHGYCHWWNPDWVRQKHGRLRRRRALRRAMAVEARG